MLCFFVGLGTYIPIKSDVVLLDEVQETGELIGVLALLFVKVFALTISRSVHPLGLLASSMV